MSTSSASSPLPFWIMLAIDTPCSAEDGGDLGQHPGAVGHVHLDEEGRLHLVRRIEVQLR